MKTEPETITVTDLRERTREILENAHFKGKCYKVERAGQEMVIIVGAEEYRRLVIRQSYQTPVSQLASAT